MKILALLMLHIHINQFNSIIEVIIKDTVIHTEILYFFHKGEKKNQENEQN